MSPIDLKFRFRHNFLKIFNFSFKLHVLPFWYVNCYLMAKEFPLGVLCFITFFLSFFLLVVGIFHHLRSFLLPAIIDDDYDYYISSQMHTNHVKDDDNLALK